MGNSNVSSPPVLSDRLVLLLSAATGLAVSTLYLLQPLLHTVSGALGVSSSEVGLIVTLTQCGYGLGILLLVTQGLIGFAFSAFWTNLSFFLGAPPFGMSGSRIGLFGLACAVVFDLGFWGQRWIEAQSSLKNLDPSLLMWDMRRNLDPTPIPSGRMVIQIVYPELKQGKSHWWLVVEGGETDLCNIDPGFDVDLHIATDLRTMTAIWMGLTTVKTEEEAGRLHAVGNETLKKAMQQWLGLSPFAAEKKRVSA